MKKPKCKTCKDTGQVGKEESFQGRSVGFKECPDCPEPTELVKEALGLFANTGCWGWTEDEYWCWLGSDQSNPQKIAEQALDELDRLTTESERLKLQLKEGHHCSSFEMCNGAGTKYENEIKQLQAELKAKAAENKRLKEFIQGEQDNQ